jgi:cytochrome c biogenesis protein CcdA
MQESILALLDSHSILAFLGAFGAGGITAAAPCSLVAVPLLVGSAVALNKDLEGRQKRLYTYAFTALFALGVMLSFSILGFIVAKFGGFFSIAPMWAYISASILSILIGLYAWASSVK